MKVGFSRNVSPLLTAPLVKRKLSPTGISCCILQVPICFTDIIMQSKSDYSLGQVICLLQITTRLAGDSQLKHVCNTIVQSQATMN